MILSALVHLYEELCKQGKIQAEGWGIAKVTHRILLDKEGHLCGIISARKKVQRGKKEIEVPCEMCVPLPVTRSSGVKANFLCDNSSYFLAVDAKGKVQRTIQCFEAAKELHHRVLEHCHSPVAKAILHFFDTWGSDKAGKDSSIQENLEDIIAGRNFVFQVDGVDAIEDEEIRRSWENFQGTSQAGKDSISLTGQCLITGAENQKIALLHPKIKGVHGAKTMDRNLVSFNEPSFCSYGKDKKQGENSPISEHAAFAYGTALNQLLADQRHTQVIGDTTIVYWSEHGISACQDFMMSFLGNNAGIDDHTLDTIVTHMRNGLPVDLEGVEISPDEPFYILGLSPNAGRISVRLFLRNTFSKLVTNLSLHQERMKLEGPSWEKQNIPLWKTLKATVNPNGKEQAASPLLSGSLFRAVLQDTKYPASAFQNILLRIFADQDKAAEGGRPAIEKISHTKAAFIKAYLLKNSKEHWEEKLQMALNENCNDVSYVLGRMFSLLENIQQGANLGINTTIKE